LATIKLLIDLDICSKCDDCGMLCSYTQHAANNGITCLRELAHFVSICRHCDDAPCVASCPWKALEKQDDFILKRYMMRCTSCKTCSSACPFGTIYPETIPFIVARCDFCIGRLGENAPICVESCVHGGIKFGEFEENKEAHIYKVSDRLVVKTDYKWERIEELSSKR
jgi:Fe-S-cluster-containing dehydrogenase component